VDPQVADRRSLRSNFSISLGGSLLGLDRTLPIGPTNLPESASSFWKSAWSFSLRKTEFVLAFPSRGIQSGIQQRVAAAAKSKRKNLFI
jgi:hypothetical protein